MLCYRVKPRLSTTDDAIGYPFWSLKLIFYEGELENVQDVYQISHFYQREQFK